MLLKKLKLQSLPIHQLDATANYTIKLKGSIMSTTITLSPATPLSNEAQSLFESLITKAKSWLFQKALTSSNIKQAFLYLLDRWEPYAIATDNQIDNLAIQLLRQQIADHWEDWQDGFAQLLGLTKIAEVDTATLGAPTKMEECFTCGERTEFGQPRSPASAVELPELAIPEGVYTSLISLLIQLATNLLIEYLTPNEEVPTVNEVNGMDCQGKCAINTEDEDPTLED